MLPFRRFRELTLNELNVDLHIHTVQTDGQCTVDEILACARKKGLASIAFTEHVRCETGWFPEFANEVKQKAIQYPEIQSYLGCEAKALSNKGDLDLTAQIISHCDIVLGAIHRFPNYTISEMRALSPGKFADIEFELTQGLLLYAPISVLAHPGGMYQRTFKLSFPVKYLRKLMMQSLERKIAFEINSAYQTNFDEFLHLCYEINPYVSIGSDVHTCSQLAQCRTALIEKNVIS